MQTVRALIAGCVMGASLTFSDLHACAFHGYNPRTTLIDILLQTEQVALARPDANDPNRYALIDTLAGPQVSEIPIGVDAQTHVLLARKPSSVVLLVRDGSYGPWLAVAVLDRRYGDFISTVLKEKGASSLWDDEKRLRLFVPLLNDENVAIQRLALEELDRAQYADLRKLKLPKVQNLRQDIEAGDEALKPIRILLAGLSHDQSFRDLLTSKMDAAIRNDVVYLGAYATALIELDGKGAAESILNTQLRDRNVPLIAKERLMQALVIQYKSAPIGTRRVISRGVAKLVRDMPELSEIASRQFGFKPRRGALTSDR